MKETKEIAKEVARHIIALSNIKHCEWISEEKALQEFPVGKESLKKLRLGGTLEFKKHWKYLSGSSKGLSAGRSGSIIYHRGNMVDYFNNV